MKERILGSYLLRFTETNRDKQFHLYNLKTGAVLQFETWVSVWAFLDQTLESDENTTPIVPTERVPVTMK
jgi:hypothetical protein